MISLIIGNKGSGKTKRLISFANETVKTSKGNVVCIEKGKKLIYDINHKARLIDSNTYGIANSDTYYGFLCGLCAADYDLTDVFADATLKIVGRDYDELAHFIEKVSVLSEESNIRFTFTISCDEGDLPPSIFENAKTI